MADILDPKQDVVSFELTKHGRKMLGMGLLQPSYVSFFDDDIVYDTRYGGISEDQNDIADRILYNTPMFKAISLDDSALLYPLGKSAAVSDYAPCWNINLLNGKQTHIPETSTYYVKNFTLEAVNYGVALLESNSLFFQGENLSNFEFDNGKSAEFIEDYILLEIDEANSEDDFKNFEIELYIKQYDDSLNIDPDALYFIEQPSNIVDGVLYDEDELPSKYRKLSLNTADASYFLDVLVDDEIDQNIIQAAKKTLPEIVKGTYKSTFEGEKKGDC